MADGRWYLRYNERGKKGDVCWQGEPVSIPLNASSEKEAVAEGKRKRPSREGAITDSRVVFIKSIPI